MFEFLSISGLLYSVHRLKSMDKTSLNIVSQDLVGKKGIIPLLNMKIESYIFLLYTDINEGWVESFDSIWLPKEPEPFNHQFHCL